MHFNRKNCSRNSQIRCRPQTIIFTAQFPHYFSSSSKLSFWSLPTRTKDFYFLMEPTNFSIPLMMVSNRNVGLALLWRISTGIRQNQNWWSATISTADTNLTKGIFTMWGRIQYRNENEFLEILDSDRDFRVLNPSWRIAGRVIISQF